MIKKEELDIIQFVLQKNGMFLINRVEDFHLLITGIILGKEKHEQERLNDFFDNFSKFVCKKTNDKIQGTYYKVIRYYSSSDYSSMELLKDYFSEFLTIYPHVNG